MVQVQESRRHGGVAEEMIFSQFLNLYIMIFRRLQTAHYLREGSTKGKFLVAFNKTRLPLF